MLLIGVEITADLGQHPVMEPRDGEESDANVAQLYHPRN